MSGYLLCGVWFQDEGVTAIEYALIGGFVAAGLVVGLTPLGSWVATVYLALAAAFR